MLVACLMFSCSDNEPNKPDGGKDDTENSGESGDKNDNPDKPLKSEIVGNTWYAKCWKIGETNGYAGNKYCRELLLSFHEDGTGYFDMDAYEGYGWRLAFNFTYTVEGDVVEIMQKPSSSSTTPYFLRIEYRDGYLYPISSDYKCFILSKKEGEFCTDFDGKIIPNYKKKVGGVWISDNGRNVLDLTLDDYKAFHLTAKGTTSYDYANEGKVRYEYPENILVLGTDRQFGRLDIKEFSEDTMVVYGESSLTTQTYHRSNYTVVPQLSEVNNILTAPDSWFQDRYSDKRFVLTFLTNGRFTLERSGWYNVSGTFAIDGNNLELDCTTIKFKDDALNGFDGFFADQTRKMSCSVDVTGYKNVNITLPEIGKLFMQTQFDVKNWKGSR